MWRDLKYKNFLSGPFKELLIGFKIRVGEYFLIKN